MKENIIKYMLLFLMIFVLKINVSALSCYGNSQEDAINIETDFNFICSGVKSENITFETNNGEDYSKNFNININLEKESAKVSIINKDLKFNPNEKYLILKISDGYTSTSIFFINNSYVTTTKKEETTTTNSGEISYTVTLDSNDNKEKTTKTCSVKKQGDICNITLPKLNNKNFNGWGTSPKCKEGQLGNVKINKDIVYYACYKSTESSSNTTTTSSKKTTTMPTTTASQTNTKIYLKDLKVFDSETNEKIDIGTFSIKKTNYEFKVLNETSKLKIETDVDDAITVEVDGNEELKIGENEIIINIKDEEENTNKYTLKVTRLEEGESLSSIHYLSALVIGNINLDFDKNKFSYDILIPKDYDTLVINPVVENKDDKVEILGNNDLINGSKISLNVIGKDNNKTTYTLNVIKETTSNNTFIIVTIGIITLLIIILITLILIKKNKNNKKNNTNNENNKRINSIETLNL